MLIYKDKEYRNLQEQVWKNADDIQKLIEGDTVLNQFGIKVVGVIQTDSDLPLEGEEFGDAYAVGYGEPYTLFIWTRNAENDQPGWLNIGVFPAPGPRGERGIQGETGLTGPRGHNITSFNGAPTEYEYPTFLYGDSWINAANGDVYKVEYNDYVGEYWELIGNIRGPQGVQGPQGIQGPQGDTGPQGPVGPQGDPGDIIKIVDVLASTNLLPDPTIVPHTDAYLVGTAAPYHLYIIVGENTASQQWFDTGAFGDFELVNISVPLTSTQGTLTADQLSILQNSPYNMINLNNEYFRLNDDMTTNGYLVYTHIGAVSAGTSPISKVITITISTLGWTLTEDTLVAQDDLTISLAEYQTKLPTPSGANLVLTSTDSTGTTFQWTEKNAGTDVEEILQFKMTTSFFYQYKSDKTLVKTVSDISEPLDSGSWQLFYDYIRENLMGMTSTSLDCSAKIGFFLSQSSASSEVPTRFKTYITSSGVVPSNIDSFKIECVGASQSAAECIINITVWTRDAREFELVMFNGPSGVVAGTWQEKASKAYVDELIGDINTVLDTINGEVI